MSLDVWFQQDIQNTLLALHSAQAAQPSRREPADIGAVRESEAYCAGFQAALQSVALAFGIALDAPRVNGAKHAGRGRLRLRESGETYVTSVSGASEAMYE
jgi:hypothetical protein